LSEPEQVPYGWGFRGVTLFCFALDDPESLRSVRTKWLPDAGPFYRHEQARVLVGTKSDLWNPSAPGAISQKEIDAAREMLRANKVILCSAKKNETLTGFLDTVILAWDMRPHESCNVA
jgi:hypothetical protein